MNSVLEPLRRNTKIDTNEERSGLSCGRRWAASSAKRAPQNYLACYYLGQSLVLVGNPDKAVDAFERAIDRKPAQAGLLEIYQTLGRVH